MAGLMPVDGFALSGFVRAAIMPRVLRLPAALISLARNRAAGEEGTRR
jgi:hypothetical protein